MEALTKLLSDLGPTVTFSAHGAATPNVDPKISNFLNISKTMHAGALLVDIGLLSMGTSFLLELAEKWLGYGQKKNVKKDQIMDINSYSPGQISMFFK